MNPFTQRTYGILINKKQEVLISDEFRFGRYFRKFPGGGVEKGEGILDALKREFKEELSLEIDSHEFLFFNDYFQQSSFDPNIQVTCFYYLVKCSGAQDLKLESYEIPLTEDGEKQQWISINELNIETLTFPIDRDALRTLKTRLGITL
tara:strand:- start:1324 stop:1770 length:447 start_codon:yes stop_codon:yes gene_type:complete